MNTYNKSLAWLSLAAVLIQPAPAGQFSANFNDGNVPAGTTVYPNAPGGDAGVVELSGGFGDTGCLKLTKAANSLQGSMIINDLDAGQAINGFTANFKLRIRRRIIHSLRMGAAFASPATCQMPLLAKKGLVAAFA